MSVTLSTLVGSWYDKNAMTLALRPLSWVYRAVVAARRSAYAIGLLQVRRLRVPVIVVGNISVGGTGKTPFVIWLVELLKREGYSPGIVSRGYRGQASHWPQQVRPDSDPVMVGDEAVVLARRCRCPIAVGPDRAAAAEALLEHHHCDLIVSDDGLQHYALGRDIEIAIVDGMRRFGNGYCLPAGPLRESVSRLESVDFTVVNGGTALRREYPMRMEADVLRNLRRDSLTCIPDEFPQRLVHAVAGIGNPARFFRHLERLGFTVIAHPFPDHHAFTRQDLMFGDDHPIIMTEKDAVKCRRFCGDNCWFLSVEARPDERLASRLLSRVRHFKRNPEDNGGKTAGETNG